MAIDLMKLTPAQLMQFIAMQAEVERQKNNAAKVRALREYYEGEHPTLLTTRQKEFLSGAIPRNPREKKSPGMLDDDQFPFAYNLVKSIVDTLRERLNVTGITVHGEGTETEGDAPDPTSVAMWQWWTANRMDAQQIRLYRRALRDGYAYVIVDYDADKGMPRFSLHKLDAGTQEPGIMVHRDPTDENRVLYAVRYFETQYDPLTEMQAGLERRTVYLPNAIYKYIRGGKYGSTWQQYQDDGDTSWPLPWVDSTGAPLGIPVVEFANPGESEIEQIIGLQNAVNKTLLDIIAAADSAGFPLIAVEYQTNGVPIPQTEDDADSEGADEFRLSPGRLIEVTDANIKRLEAANLDPMINTMWTFVQTISGISRTPTYYLKPVGGGEVPSGEALKQLESGLVRRAEERQLVFGQAWQDVFTLAYRVNQAFGVSLPDVPDMTIDISWQDANVRNELAEAQTAEAHQRLGVPQAELWKRLGYTTQEIEEFIASQQADQAAKVAAVAAAMRVSQTASTAPQNGQQAQAAQNTGGNTNGVQGQERQGQA